MFKIISSKPIHLALLVSFVLFFSNSFVFAAAGLLDRTERDWLRERGGQIKIGVLKNEPRFFVTDKDGNLTGLSNEYIKLVERKLGLKFSYIQYSNWNSMLSALYEDQIDTVNFISYTPKRAEKLLFTDPYFQRPYMFVSKNRKINTETFHNYQGITIAVPENYAILEYLAEHYTNVNFLTKDSYKACIFAVTFDKADATLGSAIITTDVIQQHELTGLFLSKFPEFPNEHRFAVRKEVPILQSILNKGVLLITKEEHDSLYKQWISLEVVQFYKSRTFWKYVLIFCLITYLTIQAVFLWNRHLKKAVKRQTQDLEQTTMQLTDEVLARKETERTLVKQETYLTTLLESIPDIVWIKDLEGRYIHCNSAFASFWGGNRDEIINSRWFQSVAPKQQEKWRKDDLETLKKPKGTIIKFIDSVQRADGHQDTIEILKTAIHDVNNNLIGVLGIARDMTHRLDRQEELRSFQLLFNSLLNNIHGFTYRRDYDEGRSILYLSQNVALITGYQATDFIGNGNRTYKSIIHPEDYPLFEKSVTSAIEKETSWDVKYRLIHRDQAIRWVRDKGAINTDAETGKLHLSGLVNEITDLKAMEEKFRQTQKMESIGILSNGIAHDFNNILGGILGYAELLLKDLKSRKQDEKVLNRLHYILTTIERAKKLVSQILEFGKLDGERLKPVPINNIIKEVAKLFGSMFPENVSVVTDLDSDSMILADTTKIHQLLMNLGTNGAYAMKANGGTLTLSTREIQLSKQEIPEDITPGNFFRLTVSDTGCGMEKEVLKDILQPFFTTKKQEGTGMGLWLVTSIVEELKGFMSVSSEVGKGTVFTVNLPIHTNKESKTGNNDISDELSNYAGTESILYVDDEKTLTELAGIFLSKYGYRLSLFNSPIEALEDFEKNCANYDIVITDMDMPEIFGDKLLEKIRKIRPEIKVLLTTGFQSDPGADKRFNKVLIKPVPLGTMIQTIRTALDE